ncbi:lithostathine-1-beta-like [Exaiptasia diaphana]|uniref:C-type lectin domain-containing protein n=1 Tax=Exaiptasia diaphana TaxID=2652724 RepID=A0A913XJI8_EXADI|nr:lithostathine-1-beta-like [Exaiptasia diaphana]
MRLKGSTWNEGQETCSDFNKGGLVVMETEGERNYIKSMIRLASNKFENKWYIGLKKEGDSWKWTNDIPVTSSHWSNGQPSGQGNVGVMTSDGMWFDEDGTKPYGIICEYESDGVCVQPGASFS